MTKRVSGYVLPGAVAGEQVVRGGHTMAGRKKAGIYVFRSPDWRSKNLKGFISNSKYSCESRKGATSLSAFANTPSGRVARNVKAWSKKCVRLAVRCCRRAVAHGLGVLGAALRCALGDA